MELHPDKPRLGAWLEKVGITDWNLQNQVKEHLGSFYNKFQAEKDNLVEVDGKFHKQARLELLSAWDKCKHIVIVQCNQVT